MAMLKYSVDFWPYVDWSRRCETPAGKRAGNRLGRRKHVSRLYRECLKKEMTINGSNKK
jgi:hypothetical protein